MALTVGNIGPRYSPEDIISKRFKDAAAADHEAYRVVRLDNTAGDGENYVQETAAITEAPVGVTMAKVSTTSDNLDKAVEIQTAGIAYVKLTAATVTAGDLLEAVASGLAQTKAAGQTDGNYTLGIALKSGAASEIIPVAINVFV